MINFIPVPPLLASPSPKLWAKFVIYYISLSCLVLTWISQNFVFITYANQKLFRNLFVLVSHFTGMKNWELSAYSTRLNNNSAGRIWVVEWGVDLYWSKNQYSSCSQTLFYAWTVCIAFPRGCIKRSTSAFPWGHFGVVWSNCIPSVSIYLANSVLLKGGPLSEMTWYGRPCTLKILSKRGITEAAFVDRTISTSGVSTVMVDAYQQMFSRGKRAIEVKVDFLPFAEWHVCHS